MVDAGHRRGASGVVWSADGLIVTAAHKIVREEGIQVAINGGEPLAAELVGHDPSTDVAVLRTSGQSGLSAISWGAPASAAVGQLVLALARPGKTVRAALGVISTLSADVWTSPGGGRLDRYLETDIGGRAGFSGGLMVGADGTAIGMSTGGLVRGASLAVLPGTLGRVVEAILGHGRVTRGWLGVGAYPVELPAKIGGHGLVLVHVAPDGPADKAGLFLGDVLVTVGGAKVPDIRALSGALVADQDVEIALLRAGQLETRNVRVGSR